MVEVRSSINWEICGSAVPKWEGKVRRVVEESSLTAPAVRGAGGLTSIVCRLTFPCMLEQEMEIAVANCPELFIEPGLSLIRRQAVINGRRPDVLFSDRLSRHLLVEIQRGRLDEDHLQRHFYYYFDYRAKYPSTHLRLMFIANRLVPQHKLFLDEHGYEFREVFRG